MLILASTVVLWVKDVEIYLMDRAYRTVQYGLEHGVHDAALQIDFEALSNGEIHFDETKAEEALFNTLQMNIPVDEFLYPTNNLFLEGPIIIRDLFYLDDDYIDPVLGSTLTFPFTWEYTTASNYTFQRAIFGPSIALAVDVKVKGSDEYKTLLVIQEYKR